MRHTSWYICFHSAMRVDVDFHVGQVQRAFAGFDRRVADTITYCGRGAAAPLRASASHRRPAHAQQHLLAVRGKIERRHAIGQSSRSLRALRSNFESVAAATARGLAGRPRALQRCRACRPCPLSALCSARAGSGSATMRCVSLSKSMRTGLGGVLALRRRLCRRRSAASGFGLPPAVVRLLFVTLGASGEATSFGSTIR